MPTQKLSTHILILTLGLIASGPLFAVDIDNTRGADKSLDYRSLTQYGPWDDRNYQLTAKDLAELSANEAELTAPIPAFFRVEMRREFKNLRRTGKPQYPRSSVPLFLRRYGGLMRDGVVENDRRPTQEDLTRSHATVLGETPVSAPGTDGNESTVEINPVNPDLVIGGANVNAGQEMYYSTDNGDTWFSAGVLPDTCCDPTVEWSVDGTVAYAAALGGNTSIDTWRSVDGGKTWIDHREHEGGGRDKEWLHVDRSPTSPHQGNLYLSWHDGNVQKFRRNTHPQGLNSGWQPILSFPGQPRGIGSDMTTDPAGNIYYFYGDTDNSAIRVLKSTDGGATFSGSQVATTNGNFDFPIPSMALRNAWIYAAVGSDHSGGPNHGSLYVAWTDINLPVEADPANNHTQIHVAYSRDGGSTWFETFPHEVVDVLTVDRWNQWLDVDENGVVHTVFYDTRDSVNREGVDMYYSYSTDGAVTWHAPSRISGSTSTTPTFLDLQQFGDYNGISVVGDRVIPTWTDNRDAVPLDNKRAYMASVENPAAGADFILGADNLTQAVCSPGNLATISVNVGQAAGFTDPVTLAYANMPAGFSGVFSANPVTPPGSSDADVAVAAASGNYNFDITGSATGVDDKTLTASIAVATSPPGTTTLTTPADGSAAEPALPKLVWTAASEATSYFVEVDDDAGFGSVNYSATTTVTSHQVTSPLAPGVTYYWRITPNNPCGAGTATAPFSFTVADNLCSAANLNITDNGSTDDILVVGSPGTITDLNVSLNISHSYVGDLDITITHVGTGTSITLIQSLMGGLCSGNDIIATMDDESLNSVTATGCSQVGTPAVNGDFQPEVLNFLSDFDGELLAGAWKLNIVDNVDQDAGVLNEWCLIPEVDLPPPPDTDGDSFTDDEDNCPNVANSGQEDVDGDDVGDVCDNCLNEPNADQCNTNAHQDNFGNVCDADLDNNNIVNSFDLTILRNNFGATGANDSDITCNGVVNSFDLTELRNDFGQAPGPTGIAP